MKILITAGAGFIAKNLFLGLNKEFDILSLNSRELDLLDASKVFDYIKRRRFDLIIHTATYDATPKYPAKDPRKVLEYNLRMFFNLIRCKDYFGRMIYFGSGAEFSRQNWMPKMKEDYFDRYVPSDQYGFSKYIMTKYTQSSNDIYNLRLFSVFGKYDDWRTRFIPNACCHVVFGLPVSINQNRSFDFLYVGDLIKIVRWFIRNKPRQNVYNVCSGKSFDFKSIAEKIINISGKKPDISIKKRGLGKEYSGDNRLLLNELGDFKFSPIDKPINELYQWYDSNRRIIDKNELQKYRRM